FAVPTTAPQAQMACCKNGHAQCPMHRSTSQSAADCCQHDSQRQQQLAAEQQREHVLAISFDWLATIPPHRAIALASEPTIWAGYSGRCMSPATPRTSLSTVLLI